MPTPTTVSTCMPVTDQRTHVFHIFGYREYRGMGIGEFIRSGAFSVGGHEFAIAFYPDGYNLRDYIFIRLELLSKDDDHTKARVCCDLRLLDHTTGLPYSLGKIGLTMLSPANHTSRFNEFTGRSMERRKFEASPYLQDDHLTIECVVTLKQPRVSKTEFLHGIEVPPSNIKEQLGELLDAEIREDVTFSVGGETFAASRKVLALRSPVFKAELYGPMREARAQHLTIEDMQPAVFRALLHFINTDSLPADVDDQHHGGDCEMIWHLLEAADRYAVDRLKVLCESILCKNLDVETVSTTLGLACQHNCERLRDICVQFVSSPHVMDAVVATQGYKDLKTTCPSAVIAMFEKTMRFNNT
ncbi:unnamed protein product [Urochloa decumbens]|uniref:Uncharacterized protein n=1 Tax=Urochloa decumbens TaxID=240449 RepID=A0ABC9BWI8_9POAL